jgi:hypothetical protein
MWVSRLSYAADDARIFQWVSRCHTPPTTNANFIGAGYLIYLTHAWWPPNTA